MIAEKYRSMSKDGCFNEAQRESGLVVATCVLCVGVCAFALAVFVLIGLICAL